MEFLKYLFALRARLGIPAGRELEAQFEYLKSLYDELERKRAERAGLDQPNKDLRVV